MPEFKTSPSQRKTAAIASTIALLATFGAGCSSSNTDATPTPAATNTATPPATTDNRGTSSANTNYKDGTYTAKGEYRVHAGPEEVQISVTLKDGVVTDTSFQGTPRLPMSQRFMDMFRENYKPLVIGKKLSELKLGKVSGSSLTPQGFNNAIEKIKQQAST